MARTIGPTVDILLERVRQSGGIAVTTDFATKILTISQRIINLSLARVTTTENFSTLKEKLVYSIPDDLPNCDRMLSMVEITGAGADKRELFKCSSMKDFAAYELAWFRNITSLRFEAWYQLSRDYFIIYPGKAANDTIQVTYTKKTAILSDYTTYYDNAWELPDEDIEAVLKLAEAVLLLKNRKPAFIQSAITSLVDLLGAKNVDVQSANT